MRKIIRIVLIIGILCCFLLSCKHDSNHAEWFVQKLNMKEINKINTSNVTIAILDTGYNKEVLNKYKDNISEKYNFVENTEDIECKINYHASNIISLIIGDLDVYGYYNDAKVIPIVVADDYGHTDSNILSQGIYYAVSSHVQIICISMGSYVDYDMVKNAISYALQNDIIVIAASGDKGMDRIMFPAAYDGVYAISSQNKDGTLSENANYAFKSIKVPGNEIKVIDYIDENTYYYKYASGSSYSAAIFSCLACNMLSVNDNNVSQTKNDIDNIAYDKCGFLNFDFKK
jgi:thermitase